MPDQPVVTDAHETHTTVTYEVQEYLPVRDKWVSAYNGLTDENEALAKRDGYRESMLVPEYFRVVEITMVTTVKVID